MKRKNLREGFESLNLGSHVCCIYGNKEEKLSMLVEFMEIGLERNEKCLYVFDECSKEKLVERFKERGLEIDRLMDSGKFEFLTKRETYLKDGYFSPDKMFELLQDEQEKALDQGFSGLRATGEMTWFFTDTPGVEKLMEYESRLNEFIQGKETVILCQYNENKFSADKLLDVIHTHPKVVINDFMYENHYYMPVDIFHSMLKGEVDEESYEKIKRDLIEEARLTGVERSSEKKGESLSDLLQTLEKLE